MSKGLILSGFFHGLLVTLVWIGFPFAARDQLEIDRPIVVELVEIAEVTAAPPDGEPALETEEVSEPFQAEEIEQSTASEIIPPPPPETEKIAATDTLTRSHVEIPPRKPAPPKRDPFNQLVSLVKDLQQEVSKRPAPNIQVPEKTDLEEKLNTVQAADRATLSERDAIKTHIERCWRIDPGKEGIQNLTVDLRVGINPDGSVRQAVIEDTGRYFSDPAFRTFADSARTAVLSCSNVPISPQRYEIFKDIVFTFSPRGRIN
ncbi:MAG: cell envelope integrity protein TolA [Rhodospirillaceae bacterium]